MKHAENIYVHRKKGGEEENRYTYGVCLSDAYTQQQATTSCYGSQCEGATQPSAPGTPSLSLRADGAPKR